MRLLHTHGAGHGHGLGFRARDGGPGRGRASGGGVPQREDCDAAVLSCLAAWRSLPDTHTRGARSLFCTRAPRTASTAPMQQRRRARTHAHKNRRPRDIRAPTGLPVHHRYHIHQVHNLISARHSRNSSIKHALHKIILSAIWAVFGFFFLQAPSASFFTRQHTIITLVALHTSCDIGACGALALSVAAAARGSAERCAARGIAHACGAAYGRAQVAP